MRCTYLKELRRWDRATAFLAPCKHVLREKSLVGEEEGKEEADRKKISTSMTTITVEENVTNKEMSCKSHECGHQSQYFTRLKD